MCWNGDKLPTIEYFLIWASPCIEKVEPIFAGEDFEEISYLR